MPELAEQIYKQEISYELPPDVPHRYLSGATPIFTAYGCALLERQTAKSHVYSAVNLSSGKTETLCRKAHPLEECDHIKMAVKIKESSVAGAGCLCIDREPGDSLSHGALEKILWIVFTEVLPQYGYAVRENQIELAEHILTATSSRNLSLAESEVGTGKTLAYLIAGVLARRGRLNDFWLCGHYPRQSYAESFYKPVVIATSSIALQRAIIKDYIPQLSNILIAHGVINAPLTSVIRKGKEHFFCEKRLLAFYTDADEKTKALLHPLLDRGASCDLADAEGLSPYIKRKICIPGKCADRCRHAATCRYQQYQKQANDPKVDFLICNHNYYLADVLHRAEGKRPLLPHYQLVIVDEAHKFLSAARQMYGVSLEENEISILAASIHSFTEGKSMSGVNIHRLAKKLEEQSVRLFRELGSSIPTTEDDETDRFPAIMNADASRHMKSIAGIADDLISALGDSYTQPRFKESKARAIWELENLTSRVGALRKHRNLVCWLEPPDEDSGFTLQSIPKNLDERLHQDIWSKGLPIILTSGTLSTCGRSLTENSFDRAKQSLGITRLPENRIMETSQSSPFDYKQNTLLYISNAVLFPNQQDKDYLRSVADEVERLGRASYGHAAVLFTSYNAMGQVFALLKERELSYPMFQMGRRDTAALEKFKASGNGILFASGALWEGIDIPGDALSMLIVIKLPFAVPDPIGDYERTLYTDMDAYKNQALVPDMLVKLKQGFGRLIRTETDTGVCAILDSRARKGAAYHERVLDALPSCHTTSDLGAVRQFMIDRKSPAYFE